MSDIQEFWIFSSNFAPPPLGAPKGGGGAKKMFRVAQIWPQPLELFLYTPLFLSVFFLV